MERLVCLLIGYLCGLFQTSYLYGKLHKIDIREYGSGNAGTTNALRTMGKKAGALTLFGDCFKCILAVLIVRTVFAGNYQDYPGMLNLMEMYAAFGCILGHNFPFYLKFKGGKGVAASVGMILAVDWRIFLICAVVFFIIFFFTHYVSLCSICTYIAAFILLVLFGQMGHYGLYGMEQIEMDVVMFLMTVLAVYRHKANILRLMNGTENKLYLSKVGKK